MAKRRRRGLTTADREIWDRLRATVKPLHSSAAALPQLPVPEAPPQIAPPASGPIVKAPSSPAISLQLPERAASAPVRMDSGRYQKMRRGMLKPEARIDLHGMTARRAHAALSRFIHDAHAAQLRLVLVITGKGREGQDFMFGDGSRGVLRRSVPMWLAQAPLAPKILQITEAHRRHGGEGAFYIYLARSRKSLP